LQELADRLDDRFALLTHGHIWIQRGAAAAARAAPAEASPPGAIARSRATRTLSISGE
jgi:hypothetical protein